MKKITTFLALSLLLFVFLGATFNTSAAYKRMVLVEEFTNTSCGPCASQNPSFQSWMKQNISNIVPVTFHSSFPGSSDPMYQTDKTMNDQRVQYYAVNGVPACRMNGVEYFGTNGWYNGAPGDITALDKELAKYKDATSYFNISINEVKNGNTVNIEVTIKSDANLDNKKLRVVVTEAKCNYPNMPNGESEFFYVSRKMLPDYKGIVVNQSSGETKKYTYSYTVNSAWSAPALYIVAFLQDETTREVVQAASNISAASASFEALTNKYLKVDANASVKQKITLKNPNDFVCGFTLEIDNENSKIPSNWDIELDNQEVYDMEPNATQDINVTIKSSITAGLANITIKATPISEKALLNDASVQMYCLSNATKYAVYNANAGCAAVLDDVLGYNEKTTDQYAFIPFDMGAMAAYDKTWDGAFFCFNYSTRGVLGGDANFASYSNEIFKMINNMIAAGKKIFVQTELDYYYATNISKNTTSLNFFNNTLGLTYTNYKQYYDGSNISLFKMDGISGDPVSEGFSNNAMNSGVGSAWPYITIFADYFSINSGSKSKPMFYIEGDNTKVSAVRYENDKTKLIYTSVGLESIPNYADRFDIANKIIDYLFTDPSQGAPALKLSANAISYGKVNLNTKSTKTVNVTNTGNADLLITDISVDEFTKEFVIKNLPTTSNPLTIKPNESATITIEFTPTAAQEYSDFLNFTSNAKTSPDFMTVDGYGVDPNSSVKDYVSEDRKISLNVTPNLINESAEITVNLKELSTISLNLYNSNGDLVQNIASSSNDSKINFSTTGLTSGKYYIVGNSGSSTAKVPVIIVK